MPSLLLSLFFLQLACATTAVPQHDDTITPPAPPPTASLAEDLHDSHYVGIFQDDRLQQSFPAVLDLVLKSGKDDRGQLLGVLRIYAPETKGTSYRVVSSYYSSITLQGDELDFTAHRQQIRVVQKGQWQGDKISAFVVVYGFGQGQLHLTRQARTDFNLPPVSPSYPLALSAFKLPRVEFPQRVFAEQGAVQVEQGLLNTSKNLLQRDLFDVNYASIDRFGTYYGVLHHEQLDAFQYVRLAFVEDQEAGITSAVSTLFFAEPKAKQYIVYRYRAGRNVMHALPPVLLGDDEDNSEAFLLFKRWDKRGISGVWYSKVHGRIGNVFLMRERFPRLAKNAKLVPSLQEHRQQGRYSVDLQMQNTRAQHSDKVFAAPLSGTLNDTVQEKKHQITAGSYDFYRGIVELTYEGGTLRYSVYDKK